MAERSIYGKFYNPERLASFNKGFFISMGYRSIGKSTGIGIYFLRQCIKSEIITLDKALSNQIGVEKGLSKQLLYMRRTGKGTNKAAPYAFEDALELLNEYEGKDYNIIFRVIKEIRYYFITGGKFGNELYLLGYAFSLAEEQEIKSIPFGNIAFGMFDEFLCAEEENYLGRRDDPYKEWRLLNSLYITINRARNKKRTANLKMFLIGNTLTYYNPILIKLGADKLLKSDTAFLRGDCYVVEQTLPGTIDTSIVEDDEEDMNKKISNHDKRTMMYNYGVGCDNDKWIGKPEQKTHPMCNVLFRGHRMGVSYTDNGLFFVSNKGNTADVTLALTTEDHSYNTFLAQKCNSTPEMKFLRIAMDEGNILFENGRTKFDMFNFFLFDSVA